MLPFLVLLDKRKLLLQEIVTLHCGTLILKMEQVQSDQLDQNFAFALSPVEVLTEHRGGITQLIVHPSDQILISSSKDSCIIIWARSNGNSEWKWLPAKVHDMFTGGHLEAATDLSMVASGSHFVSSSLDTSVNLWDVEAAKISQKFPNIHELGIRSVSVSMDGQKIATGSWDRSIKIMDPRSESAITNQLVFKEAHIDPVTRVRLNPTVANDYLLSCAAMQLKLWDIRATPRAVRQGDLNSSFEKGISMKKTIEYGNDGRHMVSGGDSPIINLWRIDNNFPYKFMQSIKLDSENLSPVNCAKFSPDLLYIAVAKGNNVYIWDITSQRIVLKTTLTAGIQNSASAKLEATCIAWSWTQNELFVGMSNGSIKVFRYKAEKTNI